MADQYKVLKDADGRVRDYAFGPMDFATPARLTAALAALPAGASVETFTGDLPPTMQEGLVIDSAGAVSAPTQETTNELLEARKTQVEQWVLLSVNAGFAQYSDFVDEGRAEIFEAVRRMTYYRVYSPEALTHATWWPKMMTHLTIAWREFVRNVVPGGHWTSDVLDGMRAGTLWRDVYRDAAGRYQPHVDSDNQAGPAYTHTPDHAEEYISLLARAARG